MARTTDIRSKKLSFKEQRELEALPGRTDTLEKELASLRAESESADFYKAGGERIRAVLARLDDATKELESAIERWVELEERR